MLKFEFQNQDLDGMDGDETEEGLVVGNNPLENMLVEDEGAAGDAGLDQNNADLPGYVPGAQMTWERMNNYEPRKEIFLADSGPKIEKDSILDTFLYFFNDEIVDTIVSETNLYAEQQMAKKGFIFSQFSRMWKWVPCTKEEIYILFALYMIMSIVVKPTIRSYFSKNPIYDSTYFSSVMTCDRFEMSQFLHFSHTGISRLSKIAPIISHLNNKFQEAYTPSENISIDESLLLWKGRLSFRQYIPLKAAKFGVKTYELCESSTGYTWNLMVFTGSTMDLNSPIVPQNCKKTTAIVLCLVEKLLDQGYTLWMDNFYNDPELAKFLKSRKTDCAGTLRINRKSIPDEIKQQKLSKGELCVMHSGDVSVTKWRDKRVVTMISTYHNVEMIPCKTKTNENILKPVVVVDYNKNMGGVDLRDQMIQGYMMERKRQSKWYIKVFKRLMNVTILNSYIIWKKTHENTDHLSFRLELIKQIVERFLVAAPQKTSGRPSTEPKPARLVERHFLEKLPATGKKARPQRRCVVCSKHGRRRDTIYWCPDCEAGLCLEECFKTYHTKTNF